MRSTLGDAARMRFLPHVVWRIFMQNWYNTTVLAPLCLLIRPFLRVTLLLVRPLRVAYLYCRGTSLPPLPTTGRTSRITSLRDAPRTWKQASKSVFEREVQIARSRRCDFSLQRGGSPPAFLHWA
ncbi:hypothetical protein PQG02_22120 [Nostoc sp. UHCC 0926]|uniref:hypothetical protein n=1 Tax=unclassified Nostoc TaxID=2593658 RepID=UPI00235FC546|nr:hypothetical protein [Nostoc sp. UHCC 0926]WDD31393.1 hypothetical protein PQG02_22120 [Nostoc sp. UHCC 0926]